jgi:hypothetical protein
MNPCGEPRDGAPAILLCLEKSDIIRRLKNLKRNFPDNCVHKKTKSRIKIQLKIEIHDP